MLTFRRITLSDINADQTILQTLHEIFQSTLNEDLSLREFTQYYFSQHPAAMDVTLMESGAEIVGFCSAAFYPSRLGNKAIIVSRVAIGIKKEHRGGALPTARLLQKFMRYKALHPFSSIYVAGFIANPKVYALMCKYAVQVYPRKNSDIPSHIHKLKEAMLQSMNLLRKEVAPFVLRIHFRVGMSEREKQVFAESNNAHVQHYLSLNPQLTGETGVLVLLPVNGLNITYACGQLFKTLILKCFKNLFKQSHTEPALQHHLPAGGSA